MKKYFPLLLLLILPLIISGCFSLAKKVQQTEEKADQLYKNEALGKAAFSVKYPANWRKKEISTGKFPDINDQVTFKVSSNYQIIISVFTAKEEQGILDSYNIESQYQTEVSRLLATRIIGTVKPSTKKREEAVLVRNGDYLYVFTTNSPGSVEFINFLNNINIDNNLNTVEVPVEEDKRPIYKLYFGLTSSQDTDCVAKYYREVHLTVLEEEIALIPIIIKALLSPDQLKLEELKLFTAIPENTKLLSYGYDNNKAIVNFDKELNSGGGSCAMQMRRSQIEKTLISLSEVSNLNIKAVEIQVEGSFENVLQP